MKSFLKNLCLAVLLGISLITSVPFISSASAEAKTVSVSAPAEITYQKVTIDGVDWIYVYEDGIFVHRYLDDEGD
jgi:hypothetical protein